MLYLIDCVLSKCFDHRSTQAPRHQPSSDSETPSQVMAELPQRTPFRGQSGRHENLFMSTRSLHTASNLISTVGRSFRVSEIVWRVVCHTDRSTVCPLRGAKSEHSGCSLGRDFGISHIRMYQMKEVAIRAHCESALQRKKKKSFSLPAQVLEFISHCSRGSLVNCGSHRQA